MELKMKALVDAFPFLFTEKIFWFHVTSRRTQKKRMKHAIILFFQVTTIACAHIWYFFGSSAVLREF